MYDTIIHGGHLIDPANQRNGRFDVAIKRDRIVAVAPTLDGTQARHLIDATDKIVTPGLIDLHTHVYHGVTYWGINPDALAARSGVTTWVDVGSAGAYNFGGLREFIMRQSDVRIVTFLNISGVGLTAPFGEHLNLDNCDIDLFCQIVDQHRDIIIGVKARIEEKTVGPNGLEPLRRARIAADRCGLPMMVHIGSGPPDLDAVLEYLKPGDILTHCFTGGTMRVTAGDGLPHTSIQKAIARGVILDVGHGAGSFDFAVAEGMLKAGILPDAISTDMHQISVHGPMFDLPTCMSKFLAIGVSLEHVIAATTAQPAKILNLPDVGSLHIGAKADVAILRNYHGTFHFYDIAMATRQGTQLLACDTTILNGRVMPKSELPTPAPWSTLRDYQQAIIDRGHTPQQMIHGCCE
ncbi:MAG: amidohydrolase/deacetylase family metallohydrolase [Roseiflexaceae bacterium]